MRRNAARLLLLRLRSKRASPLRIASLSQPERCAFVEHRILSHRLVRLCREAAQDRRDRTRGRRVSGGGEPTRSKKPWVASATRQRIRAVVHGSNIEDVTLYYHERIPSFAGLAALPQLPNEALRKARQRLVSQPHYTCQHSKFRLEGAQLDFPSAARCRGKFVDDCHAESVFYQRAGSETVPYFNPRRIPDAT